MADTETQTLTFLPIPTRPMFDFYISDHAAVAAELEVTAASVNIVLTDLAGRDDLADAIVRLKVDDFPREERDAIDWALVRKLKAMTLHFQLDLSFAAGSGQQAERRASGTSLAAEAETFFADDVPEVRALIVKHMDTNTPTEVV